MTTATLNLRAGIRARSAATFDNIDWSRTRAYGLGLNGLYINVQGREASGIVDPRERESFVREIGDKLVRTIDPATGAQAVTRAFRREDVYSPIDRHRHRARPDRRLCEGHADASMRRPCRETRVTGDHTGSTGGVVP